MKLTTLVVACLAPLGLSATPVTDPSSVQPHKVLAKPDRAACGIVNTSSKVNCRKGAGTKYDAVASVTKGTYWFFDCVQTGECVTIDGSSNCGWHRLSNKDFSSVCYVSGHYTDDNCTLAKLGKC